jgi:multiple sugar transport system substrate-binding protein
LVVVLLVFTGCGGQGDPGDQGASSAPAAAEVTKHEPVTLRMLDINRIDEENFNLLIAKPLSKKYPYITVEYVPGGLGEVKKLPVDTGNPMDLVLYWNGTISEFQKYDLLTDLRPMVKSHNIDLSQYQDNMLQPVTGTNNELYGLPFYNQGNALYYNKDLFDKFGVPYPKDGLFWEDVVDLAKKMHRVDNGVTYYGYNYESEYRLHAPLSLGVVNEAAGKSVVNSEQWAKVLNMIKSLRVDAQGGGKRGKFLQEFTKEQNLAMGGSVTSLLMQFKDMDKTGLNWDLAQFPSWKERPNVSSFADLGVIGLLKTSKHPEEASKVIEVFLTDEIQRTMVSHSALVSPFKGKQYVDQFAKDIPELQGKRLTSIFKSHSAPFPAYGLGEHFTDARNLLRKHINSVLQGKEDVNTALRKSDEEINQYLETVK